MSSMSDAGNPLSLSVIVSTWNPDNYAHLKATVDSLLSQIRKPDEIIVVVDSGQTFADTISAVYNAERCIRVLCTGERHGIAHARNVGIDAAKGDILAFTDDDVIVDKEWTVSLLETYCKTDAIAVGGKIVPVWLSQKPEYLPEELYWLVGATHAGFADEAVTEVRDTFGPNMSFKKEVFHVVGRFNENLGFGRHRAYYIQGEEPEFCLRMKKIFGKGVTYNPDAVVYHKVPAPKVQLRVLLRRSFYQGFSKAIIQSLIPLPYTLETERSYLKKLVLEYVPTRLRRVFSSRKPITEIGKLVVLLLCVLAVGTGYIYANLKGVRAILRLKQ